MEKIYIISINKPFDELIKTAETDKWCAILCAYRTEDYEDFKDLSRRICIFKEKQKT